MSNTATQQINSDHKFWPARELRVLTDAPQTLYIQGNPQLMMAPKIAIVGSRDTHRSDREIAYKLGQQLASLGLAVVSGLARGIDSAGLSGACAVDPALAIAVIGNGHDYHYPIESQKLQDTIATSGCLISEYAPNTKPLRHHFPKRNRIMAALSVGVVVVCARKGSGTMITAQLAAEYGREVMAIPGPVSDQSHAGCHQLIMSGAALVESAKDVATIVRPELELDLFEINNMASQQTIQTAIQTAGLDEAEPLTQDEAKLLTKLSHHIGSTSGQIAFALKLPIQQVNQLLFDLELKQRVALTEAGTYIQTQPNRF